MTTSKKHPVFLPNKGIVLNKPEEFLHDQVSPYSRNMEFFNEDLKGRDGLAKFSDTALSGYVMAIPKLKLLNLTEFAMFATPKDIYKYDFVNSRYDILTPVYTNGAIRVENGSAKVYGGLNVDDCDDSPVAWTNLIKPYTHFKCNDDAANTTVTDDGSGANNGTASVNTSNLSVDGTINKAFEFNGSTEYVNIDSMLAGVSSDTKGSFSFHIRKLEASGSGGGVFCLGDTDALENLLIQTVSVTSSTYRLGLSIYDAGTLKFYLMTSLLTEAIDYHIVFTQDGITPKVYIDSVLDSGSYFYDDTDKTVWINDLTGLDNGRLGCQNLNSLGNYNFTDVVIDDFRYYSDTVLSTDEIDFIYNSGNGIDGEVARNTTVFKENTSSVQLHINAAAGVELLAYHDISSIDLSSYDSIGFWFRSNVALDAGDFVFNLDNTAACASPLEAIDFPEIAADTWTWVNLTLDDPSLLTAVISIGISQAVDKGGLVCYIDQIVAGDWAGQATAGGFIKLGTGDLHTGSTWYTIDTVNSDTEITLTAVYAGSTAYQQAYTIRKIFTGGNTDYWDSEEFVDTNLGRVIVLTNGIDMPVYWNGSGQVVALTGTPTGFTAAKYVSAYKSRLIFLWCVVGSNEPTTEYFSDVANILSWDDSNFRQFNEENTDEIKGVIVFNGYHVVLKENNAYIGRWVGGSTIFDYDENSVCVGSRAPHAVVKNEDFIFYYGSDRKVHRWNLLQDDIISESLFPETKEFDPNNDEYIKGQVIQKKNQIRWFCPYNDATKHNYVFVWDYIQKIPQVWEYAEADACCCFGSYVRSTDVYADDAIYGEQYADETSGFADDAEFLDASRILIYGGYDGYVRLADSGNTDDGSEFTRLARFKRLSFGNPNDRKRLKKQSWWLKASTSGSVSIKLRLNDKTSYESATKTISLIPDNEDKDIIKKFITWNKHAETFQLEISATNDFSLLGFINYVHPKGRKNS